MKGGLSRAVGGWVGGGGRAGPASHCTCPVSQVRPPSLTLG